MGLKVIRAPRPDLSSAPALDINAPLVAEWLTKFLRDECLTRRKVSRAIVGLSGGVDSAVTASLCARAFGPENVFAFLMPYKTSSPDSLEHGRLVIEALGIHGREIEITPMVDGYLEKEPEISPARIGNVCARARMIVLFDQSAKLGGLAIGTSNKTERMFGYFTWHGDDAPPINPLGDLLKTQLFQLAEYLGVPEVIRRKPPTADLVKGQTDEGDFGITFARADGILLYLLQGYSADKLISMGFERSDVELVFHKVGSTHWKRRLPTVAMVSETAIGEAFLRPVDY